MENTRKLARVKKHVTCHLWRHSCATHLVKNNANLRHVQEILGHRSLATTERYLQLTITDLKEAHRKFHPREMLKRGQKSDLPSLPKPGRSGRVPLAMAVLSHCLAQAKRLSLLAVLSVFCLGLTLPAKAVCRDATALAGL